MPRPLVPLHKLRDVPVDTAAEVRKIIASRGLDQTREDDRPLARVYQAYKDLKTLGFFSAVIGRFGNTESGRAVSLRVCDIYEVSTGGGRLFFMAEASMEAIDAFLDDGLILLKIRDWMAGAYRHVCTAPADTEDPARLWDDTLHAPGSPLPPEVKVVPFYNKELAPGVPGVILVLVNAKVTRE